MKILKLETIAAPVKIRIRLGFQLVTTGKVLTSTVRAKIAIGHLVEQPMVKISGWLSMKCSRCCTETYALMILPYLRY